MKRFLLYFSIIVVGLMASANVYGQENETCDFILAGTWQYQAPGQTSPTFYRFAADGTVKVLAHSDQDKQWRELASANYKLNDVWAPKSIEFTPINAGEVFKQGTTAMQITQYGDASFTVVSPGAGPSHFTRVDSHRYFVVFAGRAGNLRSGGAQFAMMINSDGFRQQIETFGVYPALDQTLGKVVPMIGSIPDDILSEWVNEPPTGREDETMLRIELSPAESARSLRVMHDWQKRARQDELLYPVYYMDNIVFVDQLAKSIDSCTDKIKEYNLTWLLTDKVIADHNLPQVVFYYNKELRRLNDSLHVSDQKLYRFPSRTEDIPPEN
jgi:hypothetical protein